MPQTDYTTVNMTDVIPLLIRLILSGDFFTYLSALQSPFSSTLLGKAINVY